MKVLYHCPFCKKELVLYHLKFEAVICMHCGEIVNVDDLKKQNRSHIGHPSNKNPFYKAKGGWNEEE